ncbi:MAG: hypothetical protein IAG13_11075 [Deltaproteobacteria bacterium]|nr:hypothetical protein [Nannocystaceae bacterium]
MLVALAFGCGGGDETVGDGSTGTPGSETGTSTTAGVIESSSESGIVDSSSGSSSTGEPSACGDGMRDGLEHCDPPGEESACSNDCTLPSGAPVWTVGFDSGDDDVAADIAVRDNGEIVVVGSSGDDAWIAVYGPAGDELSSTVLELGAGDRDALAAVALHGGGMVVVGTATAGTGDDANADVLVVALDDVLATVWADRYDGGLADTGEELAIADAGELVVVGRSEAEGSLADAWIRRYDGAGTEVWTQTVDGAASGADVANAVAWTPDGGLLVTGALTQQTNDTDLWISARTGDGDEQWNEVYDGGFGDDYGAGVVVDGDAIWVTGSIANMLTNSEEAWVARYDSGGTQAWATGFNSNGFVFESGEDLVVDGTEVWIAGVTSSPDQQRNVLAARFSEPMPAALWTDGTDGGPGLNDVGHGIARLSDGSAVVVGELTVLGQGTDAWIRRYAP